MQQNVTKSHFQRHWLPYIIGLIASTFYLYDFLVRVMPAAMSDELMRSFSIGADKLGMLSSLFFYGYALMQVPAGTLFDKYSPTKLLSLMLLLCAIATAFFGISHNFYIASFCRFVIGFTSAFAYIGALKIGVNWFPTKHFALYSALVQVLGCVGGIIGSGPVAALMQTYSWQQTTFIIAFLGILFTILNWFTLRDHPDYKITKSTQVTKSSDKQFRTVLANQQQWWVALYGFSIWSPVSIFASLWGVPYLTQVYAFSPTVSASMLSIIWVGIAIGGPIFGWLTGYINLRKLPMALAAVIGIIVSIILFYVPGLSKTALTTLIFLFGAASSAQAISFGVAADINHKATMGTAIGFTNMAIIFGGVVFQPLVGVILTHYWQGVSITGVHIYSTHAYQVALSLIPFCFVLALLISAFLIRETHCKPQH